MADGCEHNEGSQKGQKQSNEKEEFLLSRFPWQKFVIRFFVEMP
jgi:hypothetical protein